MSHPQRVSRLAAEVVARTEAAPGPPHLRRRGDLPWGASRGLDLRPLDHILEIDVGLRFLAAEPGVCFRDVLLTTLPFGLMPAVVPMRAGATLGGAVSGCAGGPTSHRHGGFADTCLEYEIVTGTGEVLRCSPEADPQLFGMLHGAGGTLGVLSRIKLRLVPALPAVRVEARRVPDAEALAAGLVAACAAGEPGDEVPLVSGVLGAHEQVLEVGRLAETGDGARELGDALFRPAQGGPGVVLGSLRWLAGRRVAALLPPELLGEFHRRWSQAGGGPLRPLRIVPYRLSPSPWFREGALPAPGAGGLWIGCELPARGPADVAALVRQAGGLLAGAEDRWALCDRARYLALKQRVDPRGVLGSL